MLGLVVVEFFAKFFLEVIASKICEDMTEKTRKETYSKILKMPISWFDKPRNARESLSNRLSSDC